MADYFYSLGAILREEADRRIAFSGSGDLLFLTLLLDNEENQ